MYPFPEFPITTRPGDDPEQDRILVERSRLLATIPSADEDTALAEVMVFRVRDEEYAVDLNRLEAVQRARGLTPVPCTPSYVAGILNIRGEVITVLDLATALGLSAPPPADSDPQVLLAAVPQGRVGLLVDTVLGVQHLTLATLDRALSNRDYARGVAGARIIYLDLEQLLADERFDVLEEVG